MANYYRDGPPPERPTYHRDGPPPERRHIYDRDGRSPARPTHHRAGPPPQRPMRYRLGSTLDRVPRWVLLVGAALSVVLVATIIGWSVGWTAPAETASIIDPSESRGATEPPGPRVFPVLGDVTYGRTHHGYPATDILAPCGTVVVAVYSGVILEVNRVDRYNPAVNEGSSRGGLSVSLLGDDGVRYYGSHYSAINDNIQPGVRVAAGDPLGILGRTGDAAACHLHFGLSPPCSREGDWWIRRGTIWPWPYLDSWRAGENKDPLPEILQWHADNGCPAVPQVEP